MVRYSWAEIIAMNERGDVVPTSPDAPTVEPDEEFWQSARVVVPDGKSSVYLRVDTDVRDWFKTQGKGHLTQIAAVLRAYVQARRGGRKP